jgi:RNA polymerase sigma-70 factor (ECF subfamily)
LLRHAPHAHGKKAWAAFYAEYYPLIRRYIASRVSNREDARDLTQDVFVKFFHGNGAQAPETYIFGIAKNTVRRYFRKKARSIKKLATTVELRSLRSAADLLPYKNSATQVSDDELAKTIQDAVSELPPASRQALELRFTEGLNSREAAREACCSVNAFYVRVSIALKELKKALDQRARNRRK